MLAIPVLVSNVVAQTFILDFAQVSKTVEELTDASLVIANVTVQSVYPTTNLSETTIARIETDSLLKVTRVLKGNKSSPQLVVSQTGGGNLLPRQYSLFQPGEHCIVFLTRLINGPTRPDRGIPRYNIVGNSPAVSVGRN
jgi:hypothetical protein